MVEWTVFTPVRFKYESPQVVFNEEDGGGSSYLFNEIKGDLLKRYFKEKVSPRDLTILQQPDEFLLTGNVLDWAVLEEISYYFKGKHQTLSLKELIDLSLNQLMDQAEREIKDCQSQEAFYEYVENGDYCFSETGDYIR